MVRWAIILLTHFGNVNETQVNSGRRNPFLYINVIALFTNDSSKKLELTEKRVELTMTRMKWFAVWQAHVCH